ncbi:MAG: hypothetical protein FWF69_07000 [Firmicutes bacterium]|nr:hypothetical protein [Bacillota bacterium]
MRKFFGFQRQKAITRSLVAILAVCATVLACWPAQAYGPPDEVYNSTADLPESIREALPAQMTYVWGARGGDTIYVLLEKGDDTRRIYIFSKEEEQYRLGCESAPLLRLRNSTAWIGFSDGNALYLGYDDGSTTYTFIRMYDNTWQLSGVQAKDTFRVEDFGLHQLYTDRYICVWSPTPIYRPWTLHGYPSRSPKHSIA